MLPMLTISILYLLIGLQLRRDKLVVMVDSKCIFGTESLSRSRKQKLSKRNVQVTKMLSRYQPANWSNRHYQWPSKWLHMICVFFSWSDPGVLVVVFGLCWAPFHVDRLMWSYMDPSSPHHLKIFEHVHVISGVCFYLSSVVNPILYNLLSSRFREMFSHMTCYSRSSSRCSGIHMSHRRTSSDKTSKTAKWT